jgi:hypothetical protein
VDTRILTGLHEGHMRNQVQSWRKIDGKRKDQYVASGAFLNADSTPQNESIRVFLDSGEVD